MRTAIAITTLAAALGFGAGWAVRGGPHEVTRTVYRDAPVDSPSKPMTLVKAEPPFPDFPKPPLDAPVAIPDATPMKPPTPLSGDLPTLPAPEGTIGAGGPIIPNAPAGLPAEDLNADEAQVRRLVDAAGGEVASSADAKDATGKVGRTLVAETSRESLEGLRAAIRKNLGDRAVLSDGGPVGGSSPAVGRAEDTLAATKKKRDQARIDFLPQSPILRDLEETYLKQERALADLRRTSSRQRLDILLRPTLR